MEKRGSEENSGGLNDLQLIPLFFSIKSYTLLTITLTKSMPLTLVRYNYGVFVLFGGMARVYQGTLYLLFPLNLIATLESGHCSL
jgi:hypothetical protein